MPTETTWAPPGVEAETTPWRPPSIDVESNAPRSRALEQLDAEANFTGKGPAGIDAMIPQNRRAQFTALADRTRDPLETRATVAVQQYVAAAHPEVQGASQNWQTVRPMVARAYGVDKPDFTDRELYSAIGAHVERGRKERTLLDNGLRRAQLQQMAGESHSWLKTYQFWLNTAKSDGAYDVKKADQYRQLFEASWHDNQEKAHMIAPVVNAIAEEFVAAKKGREEEVSQDFSVGSLLKDRPLVDMLLKLPEGVSPDDVVSLAAHKAFPQTGGGSERGTLEAVGRGIAGVERNLADFTVNAVARTVTELGVREAKESGEDVRQAEQEAAGITRRIAETQRLKNLLNTAYTSQVDPLGGPVSKHFFRLAEMVPTLALAANPEIGVPLLSASFTGEAQQNLLQRGATPKMASAVGTLEGLAQTATYYLTANMVTGGLPLKIAGGAAPETLAEVATRTAKLGLAEAGGIGGITIAQQFTPPLIESLASSLSTQFPKVNWNEQFESFKSATPDTLITLAPLVLLGTGVAGFKQVGKWRDFTGDVTVLTARGFSPEVAQRLAKMPLEERIGEIQKLNDRLNDELKARAEHANVRESARVLAAGEVKAENMRQSRAGYEMLVEQLKAEEEAGRLTNQERQQRIDDFNRAREEKQKQEFDRLQTKKHSPVATSEDLATRLQQRLRNNQLSGPENWSEWETVSANPDQQRSAIEELNQRGEAHKPQEGIASAAVRLPSGSVLTGNDHVSISEKFPSGTSGQTEGFLTTTGRFVSRVEAARIAEQRGQLAPEFSDKPPRELHAHQVVYDESPPTATAQRTTDGGWEVRDGKGRVVDYSPTPEEAQKLVHEINETEGNKGLPGELPAPVAEGKPPGISQLGVIGDMRGAQAMINAWNSLSRTRRAFLVHANRTGEKREIAKEYQAQENKATIFGRVNAQEIDEALARAMNRRGRNNKLQPSREIDRHAITFLREAQEDLATLKTWRDTLDQLRNPKNPAAVASATRAIEHAIANFNSLKPVASRYAQILDVHLGQQLAMGISVGERAGYVPHWQDVDSGILNLFEGGAGGGAASGFKHARDFANYFESIAAGVKPKSLDAVLLLERRLAAGQRSINRQLWATAARNVIDPSSMLPVVTDMEQGKKIVDGKEVSDFTAPKGYSPMQVGNRTVAVQEGYEGLFSALQDPGALQRSARGRALLKGVQLAKSTALFFDTFHLGRIAMHELVLRGDVRSGRGVLLLDHTPAELTRMIDAGELGQFTPQLKSELLENKRRLDLLVDQGLNVAAAYENLNADWVHNLPGIGAYNHWLFEKFQRGGMALTGLVELERMKRQMPGATEAQVAARVAADINVRFGNLGAQSWVKSKTFRDLLRVVFLAPGWNEGLLRSELGAIIQLGETAKTLAMQQRFVGGTLLRNVGGLVAGQFLANQVINYATRGKPTWENQEEGFGSKVSAWIPDVFGAGPGFLLNPFSLPAEISHTLMQKIERGEDASRAALDLIRNKLSSVGRAADIFIERQNLYPDSGMAQVLKSIGYDPKLPHHIQSTADMAKSITNALLPVPIPTTPIVKAIESRSEGEITQSRPGEIQSQLMQSAGVKTESAPSAMQRMQRLAAEFKKTIGVKSEFVAGDSDYSEIKKALLVGNKSDVQEALNELLTKRTPDQIMEYFVRAGRQEFTGSVAHERQFIATLNEEQRKTYDAAVADRQKLAVKGLNTIVERLDMTDAQKSSLLARLKKQIERPHREGREKRDRYSVAEDVPNSAMQVKREIRERLKK